MPYQIIDVNLNRASEGLRVIDDILRFKYKDSDLQQQVKLLRHNIFSMITEDLNSLLLKHRKSESDIGKESFENSERSRKNIREIMKKNFRRVEESFRVLEEITKLIDEKLSLHFKRLRFETYQIEKNVLS